MLESSVKTHRVQSENLWIKSIGKEVAIRVIGIVHGVKYLPFT